MKHFVSSILKKGYNFYCNNGIVYIGLFFAIFLGFFWCAYKNSNFKGLKRFSGALKMAVLATWIWLNSVVFIPSLASAKTNDPSFGVDGFQPSITKQMPRHYGHFGSQRTSDNSGDPKKDPFCESELDSKKNILKKNKKLFKNNLIIFMKKYLKMKKTKPKRHVSFLIVLSQV